MHVRCTNLSSTTPRIATIRIRVRRPPTKALLRALMIAVAIAGATPVAAQQVGVAATLNMTQYEDRITGTTASAKGFGFELLGGGVDGSGLYGFASLDFYTVSPGPAVRKFGVWNVGFKIWPKAFEPGFRPWAGAAVGLGGGNRQITPVVLAGVNWMRKDAVGIPFLAAEYATKYQRARLKIGYMLGG